jgi:CHASE3 domain sensor protein
MEITLKLENGEIEKLAETATLIVSRILDSRRASEDLASETAASITGSLGQVALAIADKVVSARQVGKLDEILSAVKAAKKSRITEEAVAYEDLPPDIQQTIRQRDSKKAAKAAYAKTAGRID